MIYLPSELPINPDGSVYHLGIKPEHLAPTIILVGDPGRVERVAAHFDTIEARAHHREFVSATGTIGSMRLMVLSTGIGTDNIDIVVNELDALANIDFETRTNKAEHTSLQLVRLGTSGSIQKEIQPGSLVMSEWALGFDNLIHYYAGSSSLRNLPFEEAFMNHMQWNPDLSRPYAIAASQKLVEQFRKISIAGITISSPGFYGPQGRELRIKPYYDQFTERIASFRFEDRSITNFEMEGSAIYGLSRFLGHEAITVCSIIANRITKEFDSEADKTIGKMIELSLDVLLDLNKA